MRHWLLTRIEDTDRSFVVTDDLQSPADVGYPESDFEWRRLASAPGAFDMVDEAGVIAESTALRAAVDKRLPGTVEALEQLIADRVAAALAATIEGNGGD